MERTYTTDVKPGNTAKVMGWVHEKRDLGKLMFIILRDMKGLIQLTCKKGETSEKIMEELKKIPKESVISIEGKSVKNEKAISGVEVKPEKLVIVSQAQTPLPMEVAGKVESTIDTRLDNRFLDLRKPKVQAIFKIQGQILSSFREHLKSEEFVEIKPPSLIAAASEGGADLFPVPYYNKEAFLSQSPQLYKQMVVIGGLEKPFMIVPVWRAEKSHTTQHLSESRQMDIEMAFATHEDAMDVLGRTVQAIFKDVKNNCKPELELLGQDITVPEAPLKKIEYSEVLKMLAKKGIKIKEGDDITPEGEKEICGLIGWEKPFLITDWPTDIRAFYSMPEEKNPKICRAFDLMYKGIELSSGAQRIHIPELLIKQLKKKGLNPDNFKFYIDTFRYGAPYHAGWSIGLERITMAITGAANIREACLFPRDTDRLTP